MRSATPCFLLVMIAIGSTTSAAGELVVGFGSGAALETGDATTLATAAGPSLGVVTAITADPAARVFVAANHVIHRLAPDHATVVASIAPPHDVVALACGEGGGLFVAAQDGTVSELDPASGALLRWSSLGAPTNAMIADGGRLYAVTADGQIWSASESDLDWELESTGVPYGVNSIAARGSTLLVGTPGHVFVFQRDSGALIYGYNVPNDAAAIALEGNDVVVGGNDGSLYRVDPGLGTVWVAQSFSENGAPSPITALAVVEPAPFASLKIAPTGVWLAHPSPSSLRLEVSDSIGHLPYLVLGSMTGTKPGTSIAGRHLPLNPDAYFSLCLNGNPFLLGGFGVFSDANAFQVPMADAWFAAPAGLPPSLGGLMLNHAYVVFDPAAGAIRAVSNPAAVIFVP
jgi:hypothetical protein